MPTAPETSTDTAPPVAVDHRRLLDTPADERFSRIARLARHLFRVSMACIEISEDKFTWLKSVEGFDDIEGKRKDAYCGQAAQDGTMGSILIADPRACAGALAHNCVYCASAPLHLAGEQVGTLCIGNDQARQFSEEQLENLLDLAAMANDELRVAALSEAQFALTSSHEALEMKSCIDSLTHLWNRQAILDVLEAELTQPEALPIAVLLIDIDHFKNVNDTWGHLAGDEVLRVLAGRLRAGLRSTDAVGRYGGEEFVAMLPTTEEDEACGIAERIRALVSDTAVVFQEQEILVTCSIGVAIATGTEDVAALIQRADRAMYRAKTAGRNRFETEADAQGLAPRE